MIGIVKRIPPGKFFGFINSNGAEYFFHRDDYKGDWHDLLFDYQKVDEVKVKFSVVENNDKGPRACSVERID